MTLMISLNGAEADALGQILNRHAAVLDRFERKQLGKVAEKVSKARTSGLSAADPDGETWRRFVWTTGDITILRRNRTTSEGFVSPDASCSCECHALGMTPQAAPGRTWCAECLADSDRLDHSPLVSTDVPRQGSLHGRCPSTFVVGGEGFCQPP